LSASEKPCAPENDRSADSPAQYSEDLEIAPSKVNGAGLAILSLY
jgi:hypothetical protein